ncbi:MAG: phosphatase [Deltaproteobacteria bacterium]|jgi:protein-tyrosine phosphatase|nr:phosphatase [Deltaproteobacteria bacterium]
MEGPFRKAVFMTPKGYIKTSDNNPLRLDSVPLGNGLLGISICPGKNDDLARSGPCHRDLYKDLLRIKNWGAKIIVTLLEDKELRYLKVPNLGEMAKEMGFSWWRFHTPDECPLEIISHPILDPDLDVWTIPNALLRQFVKAGNRALIHCRGGLGRTGTLVSRLLIEEGENPNRAIETVRKARRGSVENTAQVNYLRDIPRRLKEKQALLAALKSLPVDKKFDPMTTLTNNPANFDLQAWVQAVKLYLPS